MDISNDATSLGYNNPFRYRGYYYDTETGLYYLNARYYNPEWGRFINADTTDVLDGGNDHILENNLFAYCLNNPVNMSDDDGQWPKWATKLAIGVGAVLVGAVVVAATAATGGAAAAFMGAAAAGLKAAAISGAIGAAVGAGTSAVGHRISTGSWKDSGKSALGGAVDGFADGFMWGGIGFAGKSVGSFAQSSGIIPKRVKVSKVLNNPANEFVTVGPKSGKVSEYARTIKRTG